MLNRQQAQHARQLPSIEAGPLQNRQGSLLGRGTLRQLDSPAAYLSHMVRHGIDAQAGIFTSMKLALIRIIEKQ